MRNMTCRIICCFLFFFKGICTAAQVQVEFSGKGVASTTVTVQSGTCMSKLQCGLGGCNAGGSDTMQSGGTCWSKLPQRVREPTSATGDMDANKDKKSIMLFVFAL